MTTLSLVCHCPNCEKNGQPKFGTKFVVYGKHHNSFHIYTVEHKGMIGFTPHIIQLKKVIGENVIYEKACGICGVSLWKANDSGEWCFAVKNWERVVITLKQWNDWVLYKTDPDFWI